MNKPTEQIVSGVIDALKKQVVVLGRIKPPPAQVYAARGLIETAVRRLQPIVPNPNYPTKAYNAK